jgi:hypothetical protein
MLEINQALKEIYFQWANSKPFKATTNNSFESYLFFNRYHMDDKWLEKILDECNLSSKNVFEEQVVLLEMEYREEMERRRLLRINKKDFYINVSFSLS